MSLGAVLFSAIDKLKPWPVSLLENEPLPWSLGIALDDIAAGLVIAGLLASGRACSECADRACAELGSAKSSSGRVIRLRGHER
ncbi:MAG: phosphatidylglycerophosphatase A [Rhodoplanes sp.]